MCAAASRGAEAFQTEFRRMRESLLNHGVASRKLLDLLFQWDAWDRSRDRRDLWGRIAYTAQRGDEICACLVEFGIGVKLDYPRGAYLIPSYAPLEPPPLVQASWSASEGFRRSQAAVRDGSHVPPGSDGPRGRRLVQAAEHPAHAPAAVENRRSDCSCGSRNGARGSGDR